MPLVTRFKIGGINKKSSYIDFPQDDITDSLNVEKDKNANIKKRDGFSQFAPTTGGNIIGMVKDPFRNEIVAVTPTEAVKVTSNTKTNQGKYYGSNFLTASTKAKLYPFAKNIYILDQNNYDNLYKFDGSEVFNAGCIEYYDNEGLFGSGFGGHWGYEFTLTSLPQTPPVVVIVNNYYYAFFIIVKIMDKNGNFQISNMSDLTQEKIVLLNETISGFTLKVDSPTNKILNPTCGIWQDGHETRSFKCDGNTYTTSPFKVINVDSGHEAKIGDYICNNLDKILNPSQEYIKSSYPNFSRIISTTATSITFDYPIYYQDNDIVCLNAYFEVYAQKWASALPSAGPIGNLKKVGNYNFNTKALTTTVDLRGAVGSGIGFSYYTSDAKVYDGYGEFSFQKEIRKFPPKSKTMWNFQDLLFLGNESDNPKMIFWSKTDSYEVFNIAEDNLVFNDEESTEVTAIRDLDDYLIV